MTKQVQRRRGTSTQHTSFTGAEGEISVNTTNKSIHVHDGLTAGGVEAARADLTNVSDANLNAALSGNTLSSLTITSVDINGGTIDGTTIGGTSPAAVTTTSLVATTADINGGTIDGAVIGGSSAAAITGTTITATTLSVNGDLTIADKIIHAGDTNTAIRFPAADTVTIETSGAERLRITSAGDVGIGATPTGFGRFEVTQATNKRILTSTAAAYGGNALVGINDAGAEVAFGIAGSQLIFATGATERLRIDASGNLGLGGTPSGWAGNARAFELDGQAADYLAFNSNVAGYIYQNGYYDGSNNIYKNSGSATAYGQSSGTHQWFTAPSGTAGNAITFTQAMTLDASGNLGVGTTSPSAKLELQGNSTVASIKYLADGGSALLSWKNSSGTTLWSIGGGIATSQDELAFVRQSTTVAKFDASGNLLVGTTGLGTGRLQVLSPSGTNDMALFRTSTSFGNVIFQNSSGTQVGYIQSSATATSYVTSSDYRLKENVAPMQNALDTVAQLNPVTYTWKADGSAGQGFIAHELQAVVPDCVTGEKDAVDETGNPQYQGVDTSFLVATLVKAIQELKAEVDSLRAQLNP